MDPVDKKIVILLQEAVPLSARPFAVVGDKLGLKEEEVLKRVKGLCNSKVIRWIGPIADTVSMGYKSSLVAVKVSQDGLDRAAEVINSYPGVSHNYVREQFHLRGERSHTSEVKLNLWFTIAVPPGEDLEKTVKMLTKKAGSPPFIILPTIRTFKIKVKLDVDGDAGAISSEETGPKKKISRRLSENEIKIIKGMKDGIKIVKEPFGTMGIPEDEVLKAIKKMLDDGIIRRVAAILYHREIGFSANGMGVWKVDKKDVKGVGNEMAKFDRVSHCYERPSSPEWSYSLYTMVHGKTREECEEILKMISKKTGVTDYKVLYSVKEYKKTRIPLFSKEFEKWHSENKL